jgi:C-terminal processing protease CtpA/Prc
MSGLLLLVAAAGARAAPTAAEAERIPAAEIRADLADLYRHLQSAHYDLYARVPRSDYDRLFRRSLLEIRGPETRFEVGRRFQRFVAFGRVAHARIDENYRAYSAYLASGGKAFPLTLKSIGGSVYVASDSSGLEEVAVGDEVVGLNGKSIHSWLARARRNLSADNDYMANALIELDLPMLLWLELGPRLDFALTIRRGHGRSANLSLPARSREEMQAAAKAEPPRLDLSLRDRSARMLAGRIAYLRPGPFYNVEAAATAPYDNRDFRRFIDASFEQFLGAGADRLIIDLRDNPGGDSSFSDIMVGWFAARPYRFASRFRIKASPEAVESNRRRLQAGGDSTGTSTRYAELYAKAGAGEIVDFQIPTAAPREGRRFTGRVYVLINRNSFSNAVAVAATIQDYRFGIIAGEETSDLATTYGAMENFTLKRTKLDVGFPKALIVRPNGSMAARGVVPDLAIPTPLRESPEDPVLGRMLALASARAGGPASQ